MSSGVKALVGEEGGEPGDAHRHLGQLGEGLLAGPGAALAQEDGQHVGKHKEQEEGVRWAPGLLQAAPGQGGYTHLVGRCHNVTKIKPESIEYYMKKKKYTYCQKTRIT